MDMIANSQCADRHTIHSHGRGLYKEVQHTNINIEMVDRDLGKRMLIVAYEALIVNGQFNPQKQSLLLSISDCQRASIIRMATQASRQVIDVAAISTPNLPVLGSLVLLQCQTHDS